MKIIAQHRQRRSQKPPASLLWLAALALALSSASVSAGLTAVVLPEGGKMSVLQDGELLIDIGYYDWGPGWSGVRRKASGSEQAGIAYFGYDNVIVQTDVGFSINGSWRQVEPNILAFTATLMPLGNSELVQSMYSLSVGDPLKGKSATIVYKGGREQTVALPFATAQFGGDIAAIKLPTSPEPTVLRFDALAGLTADGGAARMAIAQSKIRAAVPTELTFTLEFPEPINFLTGPESAAETENNANWYSFDTQSPIPASSEASMANWLERPAGLHGRITRDGDKLVYNGSPLKLWGLNNSYSACAPKAELADKRADFYAAMGVNSVRLHKYADGTGWKGILAKGSAKAYDSDALDRMDYYVNALKERGIYTKLSPVFISDIGPDDQARIPYANELGNPAKDGWITAGHGAIFISRELQDLLIEQVRGLLDHKNPYTGLRYADDPAIAYLETYNEDSALFGGVTRVMSQSETLRARAGALFYRWLKDKYGDEKSFNAAWGASALNNGMLRNQKMPLDESWDDERIYPVGNPWFFDPTNLNGSQRRIERRLLDTMAFLHELQNRFYQRFEGAIRATGYEGELVASNWQAGRMISHFYNLHSDSLTGTIDRHNYFGGGARGSGPIRSGSMLASAGSGMLSSGLQQVSGLPFMLSEWIHVFPNEWGVEGPAILGAYGMGLQGWDVSYPFQNGDSGTFSSNIGKAQWDVTAPHFIGVFPAVSRQVHRGDVQEASQPHTRYVHVPSLDKQDVGFEEFVEQQWDTKTFTSDVFPAEALAVTKGLVEFADASRPTSTFDLAPFREDKTLRSQTGQLAWTEGDSPRSGFITIDTPATQAVVGFTKGKTVELTDVTISPESDFSAIYFTAQSPGGDVKRDSVLVTAIARARNDDQIVVEDSVLLSRGGSKEGRGVVMEPVVATVTLGGDSVATVHVLDQRGVKTGETLTFSDNTFLMDTGRDATPYYLIERSAN